MSDFLSLVSTFLLQLTLYHSGNFLPVKTKQRKPSSSKTLPFPSCFSSKSRKQFPRTTPIHPPAHKFSHSPSVFFSFSLLSPQRIIFVVLSVLTLSRSRSPLSSSDFPPDFSSAAKSTSFPTSDSSTPKSRDRLSGLLHSEPHLKSHTLSRVSLFDYFIRRFYVIIKRTKISDFFFLPQGTFRRWFFGFTILRLLLLLPFFFFFLFIPAFKFHQNDLRFVASSRWWRISPFLDE